MHIARTFRVAAHGFNMLLRDFLLERTEPAQAKSVPFCYGTNLFDAFPGKVFSQGVILETAFQRQSDGLRHTGIRFPWREAEIKVEINGSWHIHHTAVNHYYIISHCRHHCRNITRAGHVTDYAARLQMLRPDDTVRQERGALQHVLELGAVTVVCGRQDESEGPAPAPRRQGGEPARHRP